MSNEYWTYPEGEKKREKDRLFQIVYEHNTWLYTFGLGADEVLGVGGNCKQFWILYLLNKKQFWNFLDVIYRIYTCRI